MLINYPHLHCLWHTTKRDVAQHWRLDPDPCLQLAQPPPRGTSLSIGHYIPANRTCLACRHAYDVMAMSEPSHPLLLDGKASLGLTGVTPLSVLLSALLPC